MAKFQPDELQEKIEEAKNLEGELLLANNIEGAEKAREAQKLFQQSIDDFTKAFSLTDNYN